MISLITLREYNDTQIKLENLKAFKKNNKIGTLLQWNVHSVS